ncbi:MAG: DUF692 domain-containing protein [Oligoflexales bacterium]
MLSDHVQRVGIGLRQPHYSNWLSRDTDGLWCEAISENYMYSQGKPLATLEKIRETKPVALHGVSMSVGSACTDRAAYLSSLKNLADRIQPWLVSDHFCWTRAAQHNSFDLLPIPFTTEAVGVLVDSIDEIQNVLRRRMYFENVSAYVGFRSSQLTEIEFINEVIARSGCGLLLDVNNVFVNAHNFGFDPYAYIDRVIPESVGEIHLAGHSVVDDFLFDTHDQPVGKEVWDLYRYALSHVGDVPTLIEWDEAIPDFNVLNTQRLEAEYHLQGVFNAPRVATEINA